MGQSSQPRNENQNAHSEGGRIAFGFSAEPIEDLRIGLDADRDLVPGASQRS